MTTTTTTNRIAPEMTSEESAYSYAAREQGFIGDFAAWLAMPRDERAEYEDGAAGIPTA